MDLTVINGYKDKSDHMFPCKDSADVNIEKKIYVGHLGSVKHQGNKCLRVSVTLWHSVTQHNVELSHQVMLWHSVTQHNVELSRQATLWHSVTPVSYTHLDVYKRQVLC